MFPSNFRVFLVGLTLVLSGCAANQLAGYQNTYYSYNVPQAMVDKITMAFREHGLMFARVVRDSVGRIQLKGSYQNEEEVDRAFIIVQTIVGIKSTSPFYPDDVRVKRWELAAAEALKQHAAAFKRPTSTPKKLALVIGINKFQHPNFSAILGEDDARLVSTRAKQAGYVVTALLGSEATKARIEAALEKMKSEVTPNDSLLIYISSHGNQPIPRGEGGDERKMSIVAYDSGDVRIKEKIAYRVNLERTSVSDLKVQELAGMPTRNTRVLIDTCYSGDILKGIKDENSQYIEAVNGGYTERVGISMAAWQPNYVAKGIRVTQSANAPVTSLSNPIDLKNFTIITATSGDEQSWGPINTFESPLQKGKMLKGSFFTQAFFEYLDYHKGQLEPAFKSARTFTQGKVSRIPLESGYKGPTPLTQIPRLEPPFTRDDTRTLYD